MSKRLMIGPLALLVAMLALVAAGCGGTSKKGGGGGGGGGGAASALPASSCSPIYYEGSGKPDYIIASDLPLQGSGRTQTVQMNEAEKFLLKQQGFKAGKYTIGFQACDDATAQAGKWESGKCSANANAYAQNKSVIGVIGTFNSGCAEIEIPILNRAPDGPIGMVSPANTYLGLTQGGAGTVKGEPDKYYPTGTRNYIRIVAADNYQGAADALYAKQAGVKKVFILNDKEAYGLGVASNFRRAAEKSGLNVSGFTAIDPKASSYEALATKIKSAGADGVFVGSLVCENGGKLIKDLRNAVGPNVKIMMPDGFTPISATIQQGGSATNNATVSVAGLPNSALKGAGKSFVQAFTKADKRAPDPYSVYAAQAAEAIVAAIAQSNGTRADVTKQLFKINLKGSILGNLSFNANGDVTSNPVSIYKITGGKSTTYKVIVPPKSLVQIA